MHVRERIRWLVAGCLANRRLAWVVGSVVVALVAVSVFGVLRVRRGNPFLGIRASLAAPEPVLQADVFWVPELPLSTLNVPVTYDLAPVIEALEGVIPRSYGSLAERHAVETNRRLEVAFALRRGPFRATLQGDTARVSTTINYQGRAWYDAPLLPDVRASCGTEEGELRPRIVVTLAARLRLDEDWTLRGEPQLERVVPASDRDRDKCRMTAFNVDVTDRVVHAASGLLLDQLPRVERAISRIDLRPRFERWWAILHEPIQLAEDVWLVIDPVAVRRGATEGSGQTLVASVGLRARPRVELGPRPIVQSTPLPQLDSAALDDGMRILAMGKADYASASRRLNEHLSGRILEHEGRTLRVRRLRVSGIGAGRVSLEMTFDGSARGRLFMVGTPAYDADQGQVHVPDLDFDVATSNELVRGYAWLRYPGIVELLRSEARWPVENIAELAEAQLRRGLNRRLSDEVQLRGSVGSVEVLGIYAKRDEMVIHVQALAEAELVIEEQADEPAS